MYKVDISHYLNEFKLQYEKSEDKKEIQNLFENLVFKLEKNLYHYNNINDFKEKSSESEEFFALMPIYFEIESLFVSMRSTVDMNLHLINFCLGLKIPSKEVYMHNIYKSKLPETIRNTFNRFTTKYNNPLWEFIYTFRNDIVHENGVFQILPVALQTIEGRNYLFAKIKKQDKDLVAMFKECMKFLDRFIQRTLEALLIYLKQQNKK